MSTISLDQAEAIGKTPLVRLNRVTDGAKARVLAKIEGRNPAFSVKCRIGASMIWEAEATGDLRAGMEVVEPTSGNTGIALAYVCAARGYKLTLTMPDSMSLERRKVMKILGANLVLTPGAGGMKGAIDKAAEIAAAEPKKFFMPQQFKNPANPAIHRKTTGPEIWEATEGKVDVLVAGVGTGGTISGISQFWEQDKGTDLLSVAVEPENSPVITQTRAGQELKPGKHKVQGIGAGFIPDTLDLSIVDRVELVTDEEAFTMARRLASEEGILCGISCGAAAAVAVRLAKLDEFADKTIVVVLPDLAERYLSTPLFADIEA